MRQEAARSRITAEQESTAREKRSKLLSRLVNADANRHQGLTQIKQKAQQDLEAVTEIRLMKTLQETNL